MDARAIFVDINNSSIKMDAEPIFIDINNSFIDIKNSAANVLNVNTGWSLANATAEQQIHIYFVVYWNMITKTNYRDVSVN